jgi:phosphoserine phosphatase RsbU/P
MTEKIPLPPSDAPPRKSWNPWRWICSGVVFIANLLFTVPRYLRDELFDRIFWRVRSRLLGSFIFIGVIPLIILACILWASSYMLFGQFGVQYITNAIQEDTRRVSDINSELADQIVAAGNADVFPSEAASIFSRSSAQFPRLASRVLRRLPNGSLEVVSAHDPQAVFPDEVPHHGDKWRGGSGSFEGILKDNRRLLLTSFRPVPGFRGFYLETIAPLDKSMEDRLRREKSLFVTFVCDENPDISIGSGIASVKISDKAVERRIQQDLASHNTYVQSDPRKMILFFRYLQGKAYASGKEGDVGAAIFHVPLSILAKNYLDLGGQVGLPTLSIIYFLLWVFVITELVSLVIGITISRRVTRSVHDMHQGILALEKGNLGHRIPERRRDQLGLLAQSFNKMSGSITRLMDEAVEKKRLENELEIAREVQATLFPKQLPHPPGMDVFGGCRPARVVSGDYYDFIVADETHLNIIVGDISGKGISAALLMANLQAAMRSQLLSTQNAETENIGSKLAEVMAQLNNQIYANSPPEKYATLFLSRYDADSNRLWYCNAGHLPPVLLNSQEAQLLEATGMVVGLFPNAIYEARSVALPPGAVLAIFTDGITEAMNRMDEEFGDKQLLDALRESCTRNPEDIWNHVISKVSEWQGDLPQHDDITLIVAKRGDVLH